MAGAVVFGAVLALGVPEAVAVPVGAERRSTALVSISAPIEVERGDEAVIGTTVRDLDTHAALGGARVVLQRRSGGEGGWAEADRAVTDARGQAVLSATVRPPATEFRVRMPRTDDHRAARSAPVTVSVS